VLRYGALPLEFKDPAEGGFVRQVSATVGKDALQAGVAAGIVGAALVAVYMILYYRLLGVAAVLALAMLGVWLWVILAWLSATQSLALTLAGVVGLIVSIGTSLDTHIVYFEHLKEDILNGRTLRSSMDRSFPAAFKTIVFANSATLIGAVILYFLTVGSVRGFAFVLGLASLLDLASTYFVLRPLVRLLARSERFATHPHYFGLPVTRTDPAGGAS
jgi:preprotein translocase subunit SecD